MSSTRQGRRTVGADNYPTPPWVIERFLEQWPDLKEVGPRWLEPAVGDGVIVETVNRFRAGIDWTVCDIRDTSHYLRYQAGIPSKAYRHGDFFELPEFEPPTETGMTIDGRPPQRWDVAILNPPFRLAMPFIRRCMKLATVVVVLQRINYMGSEERNQWFRAHVPDLYVLPNRVSFTGDGNGDSLEHAWHVWGPHPSTGVGELRLLPHTPKEERARGRRRIVHARDERRVALDALFADALPPSPRRTA